MLKQYKYRDLTVRDITNVISQYKDLKPVMDAYVFNDCSSRDLMSLTGTVPVSYRGNVYNIPICLWLLDTYPYNPPICFVKPTSAMMIKTGKHIDANGKIYLPYLHEWKHPQSDLYGLIQVMIVVFGEEPPVFSRPTTQPPYQAFQATGPSNRGQERQDLAPPESKGYCGSTIRSVTGGVKNMCISTDAICPGCIKPFPTKELELHASFCGDSESLVSIRSRSPEILQPQNEEMSCVEDVLQWLASQVDTTKEFSLCVSRTNLLERGLLLWRRQKLSSPVNTLKITFLGEAGVDTGALCKEFLTEMIGGIETRLFEGEDGKGKMPKYSLNDLDNGLFRVAGEVFAVSLAQGGPAPRFLQNWCYDFLLSGNLENITKETVYDVDISPLIQKIEETSDLSSCTEQIVSCGYTGPIKINNKANITRAIAMHAAARRTLMLQQLCEGLQLYGLIDVMRKNREVCRSLFVVHCGDDKVDSHYIVSNLHPEMSETGTLKHAKEVQILNHFQDFLMELEGKFMFIPEC
ncbi:uncharacterized protein LOC130551612 isoform X2 [Triplophysa rosa]|uniref:uncharacterized protein LOC130551612 isoform X2 n=1 Tax=Triplophysa rosa TaxID=992332 RepID=UPI002545D736|nr:uncharacterized protein LOC130551612 isoform X2 [Triplophysa rosa]